jgi:hypothetical protein
VSAKTYLEMNRDEIIALSTLTPKEQIAVDALIAAVNALPKSICIYVEDFDEDDTSEPNFKVSKRISAGSAQRVASLRKKSLSF